MPALITVSNAEYTLKAASTPGEIYAGVLNIMNATGPVGSAYDIFDATVNLLKILDAFVSVVQEIPAIGTIANAASLGSNIKKALESLERDGSIAPSLVWGLVSDVLGIVSTAAFGVAMGTAAAGAATVSAPVMATIAGLLALGGIAAAAYGATIGIQEKRNEVELATTWSANILANGQLFNTFKWSLQEGKFFTENFEKDPVVGPALLLVRAIGGTINLSDAISLIAQADLSGELQGGQLREVSTLLQGLSRVITGQDIGPVNSLNDLIPTLRSMWSIAEANAGRFTISLTHDAAMARTDFAAFLSLQLGLTFSIRLTDSSPGGASTAAISSSCTELFNAWLTDITLKAQGADPAGLTYTDAYLRDRAEMFNAVADQMRRNVANVVIGLPVSANAEYFDAVTGKQVLIGATTTRRLIYFGDNAANIKTGGGLDDRLYGGAGNDTLAGQGGSDYLEGGTGNDDLDGGQGNDELSGGSGYDTYKFTEGWGFDAITDSDGQGNVIVERIGAILGTGALKVAKDAWQTSDKKVNYTLVTLSESRKDLYITFNDRTDVIVVRNWSASNNVGITLPDVQTQPDIGVMSGDFVKKADPDKVSQYLIGPDGNYVSDGSDPGAADLITGTAAGDKIEGLLGDDALLGREGDDWVEGGAGNDILMGGSGRDTLNGGTGIDVIYGSARGSLAYPTDRNYVRPRASYPIVLAQGFTWTLSSSGKDKEGIHPAWLELTVGREGPSADKGNIIDGGAGDDFIFAGTGADVVHGGDDVDDIYGMSGGDFLFGDAGGDRIYGDGSADTKTVFYTPGERHGKDVISGGAGNDTLLGQGNDDEVYGGAGNDKIWGDDRSNADTPPRSHGEDHLDGGDGDDTLIGGAWSDEILGGTGDDKLYGDAGPIDPKNPLPVQYHGDDHLDGGEGNDLLKGEGGNDHMVGGSGQDTLYGDDDLGSLPLAAHGNDTLEGGSGQDYLDGQGGNDYLDGGAENDMLFGGLGDDTLEGGAGINVLDAGAGNDVLHVGAFDLAIGGAGDDVFYLRSDNVTSVLDFSDGFNGKDHDLIVLSSGVTLTSLERQGQDLAMVFEGGSSTVVSDYFGVHLVDPVSTTAGVSIMQADGTVLDEAAISKLTIESRVIMSATSGNDGLVGSKYADTLFGNEDNDRIAGREGDDLLEGREGDDLLRGGLGNDTLRGDAGNDTLDGGAGNDLLAGGAGADTYRFGRDGGQDTVEGASAAESAFDVIEMGKGIAARDVSVTLRDEGLVLSIAGSDAQLLLTSSTGEQHGVSAGQVRFQNGTVWNLADYMSSSLDDLLVGNDSSNLILGEEGNDTLSGMGGADTLAGGKGNDLLDGGAGNDDLLGGAGADTLAGGEGDDRLGGEDQFNAAASALSGDDSLNGGAGMDTLAGGQGDDTLAGGADADLLYGGSGDDVLRGGAGGDYLDGGAGNDVYEMSLEDLAIGPNGETDLVVDGSGVNTLLLDVPGEAVTLTRLAGSASGVRIAIDSLHGVNVQDAALGAIAAVQFAGAGSAVGMDRLLGERLQSQLLLATDQSGARLYGGALADELTVGEAAAGATVSGGRGNDQIALASLGGSTVLFSSGDGFDTLTTNYELGTSRTADNVLRFGQGIAFGDLRLLNLGSGQFNLLVGSSGTEGFAFSIDAKRPTGLTRPFDRIEFADGSSASWSQVVSLGISEGPQGLSLDGTLDGDLLTGSDDADVLHGNEGSDQLHGGSAHDDLFGEDGNDTLYGDAGNDSLVGGAGADRLYGGDGNDQLVGDDNALLPVEPYLFSDDVLDGGAGNDTLFGGDGDDRLMGGSGNDLLMGGEGNDDLLANESGNDTLLGGPGDDIITFIDATGLADGEAGNDMLFGFRAGVTVRFNRGGGSDRLSGWAANGTGGTLQLGEGIALSELVFSRGATDPMSYEGETLSVRLSNSGDMISIPRFLSLGGRNDAYNSLQRIELSDGTVLTEDDILRRVIGNVSGLFEGGPGNTVVAGSKGNDTLSGNDGDDILWGAEGDDLLRGGRGYDDLRGGAGSDWIDGGDDNDDVAGGDGDDSLIGGSGNDNDYLCGDAGNDTLDPGTGYGAQLSGGSGNDTYKWGRGYGVVTLTNQYSSMDTADTLEIGSGISTSDLLVSRREDSNDLELQIAGTGDKLVISNYFYLDGQPEGIDIIRFEDGTVWRYADVNPLPPAATQGDDKLWGMNGNDTISGGAGNDSINGHGGDDVLYGDEGDDDLDGGEGADMLFGGAGNDWMIGGDTDTLVGGEGYDTYGATSATIQFRRGDGEDVVYGASNASIILGPDILPGDIRLETFLGYAYRFRPYLTSGLRIAIAGSQDAIIVKDFFTSAMQYPQVPLLNLVFADGTVWNKSALMAKVYDGTSDNDTISGTPYDENINGAAGDDSIFGDAGHDHLTGGDGNDILEGGFDNDTLVGGSGSDDMLGGGGADVYVWGRGDGSDYLVAEDEFDVLEISAGTLPDDLEASNEWGSITLHIKGTSDYLWVFDEVPWRKAPSEIRFADGTVWNPAQLRALSLLGTEQDDTLFGKLATGELMRGKGGNDSLYGFDGADTIDGGSGNDRIFGDDGDDILQGGTGDDTISSGLGNDLILFSRGDGRDRLTDIEGIDTLRFGAGITAGDLVAIRSDDTAFIAFSSGADCIRLDGYYVLGENDDTVIDRIEFADGSVMEKAALQALLSAPRMNNAPIVTGVIPTLVAKQGSPFTYVVPAGIITDADAGDVVSFTLWGMPDWVSFDAQTRTISGTPTHFSDRGTITLGLAGDDTFGARASLDLTVNVGAPNRAPVVSQALPDRTAAQGAPFSYTVSSTAFRDPDSGDTLSYAATLADGSALPSWLTFNPSTRVFSGTSPTSGTSNIRVSARDAWGGVASDDFTITVSLQNQMLSGTSGSDTLAGGDGNDTLNGAGGNDSLLGGGGADRLDGGTGTDTLTGGAGDDVYVVDVSSDVVTELANEGSDLVQAGATYTLGANVENLTLTGTGTFNGTGNALANVLIGNSANNTLTGLDGNDTIDGGAGNDTMVGGLGDDTYVVNVTSDVITETASQGIDTVQSAITWTLNTTALANVENVTLTGTSAISATGNASANVLLGNAGANTLTGLAGADTLDGGAGNDILDGGAAADTYLFGRGWGVDTVRDNDSTAGVKDLIQFGTGIAQADLRYSRVGNNLEALIFGTADKIVVQDWYLGNQYHVEEFRFSDGSMLLDSQVQGLVSAMASFSAGAAADTSGGRTATRGTPIQDLLMPNAL